MGRGFGFLSHQDLPTHCHHLLCVSDVTVWLLVKLVSAVADAESMFLTPIL